MEVNQTIGILIDSAQSLRLQNADLKRQTKEINAQIDAIKTQLIDLMTAQDLDKASGELATATLDVSTYSSIESKEDFYRWVAANERFEFTQAKVNAAAVRELLETENVIPPGVKLYPKETIRLVKKR